MSTRDFRAAFVRRTTQALVIACLAASAQATTIVVDDAGDTPTVGKCTLREAISAATNNAAVNGCLAGQAGPIVDLIHFAIPGSGLHTITLTDTLPDITDIVTIDGYSQSGSSANTKAVGENAKLMIEVSGAGLAVNVMFPIDASGTTVKGLLVSHTPSNAFNIGANVAVSNVVIAGNFVGVDASGTALSVAANSTPFHIIGTANMLGGSTPAARNVIVAGDTAAIWIGGTGNLVQGNYINVNADGAQALSGSPSVAIQFGPLGDATGTIIGGSVAGAGNVLFGTDQGIKLGGTAHNTQIKGNYIGVDATGTYALGENIGIGTNNGPTGTIIGGASSAEGNVISGNIIGIDLADGAAGTIVKGNRIGTDASGTRGVPNTGDGILIETESIGSVIGGTGAGEGNTIAYNCGNGVGFLSGQGWAMLRNAMFANNGLGISFNNVGVPVDNDSGDTDGGPNGLQNFPQITAAPITLGMVDLAGTLNSLANKTYRLEFFSGFGCHRSGHGEARHFLGSIDVSTNGSGIANFGGGMAKFNVPAGDGAFTATATDPSGNTSELSACFGFPDLIMHADFESCAGFD